MDSDSTISIIIEILEKVDQTDLTRAAQYVFFVLRSIYIHIFTYPKSRFHFDSLAHDNSALSSMVHDTKIIPNDLQGDLILSRIVLVGTQHVPKFNQLQPDEVRIAMCLFRIEDKDTDMVVTANVPMQSASGEVIREEEWVTAKAIFDSLIMSLEIVDIGLFA